MQRHPDYRLRPFTEALAPQPLVLLGAITGVTAPGSLQNTADAPGAYRIWAVLADLSTGRIVGHETAWVQSETVDATPTAFHRQPGLAPGPGTAAYLRVCAGHPGDPIDPRWLRGLRAPALLAEATTAYEAGQADAALAVLPGADNRAGRRLRGLNGIYLANAALGRRTEAEQAFSELVDYGLAAASGGEIPVPPVAPPSGRTRRSAAPIRCGCGRSPAGPRPPGPASRSPAIPAPPARRR